MPTVKFELANSAQYYEMSNIIRDELCQKLRTSGECKTEQLAVKTAEKLMKENLPGYNSNDKHFICVIHADNNNVGYIWYLNKVENSGETNTRLAFIYIAPKFRRKGYAETAIEYLEEKLRCENYLNRLDLNVYVSNTESLRLYEKMGFSIDTNKTTATHVEMFKNISQRITLSKR